MRTLCSLLCLILLASPAYRGALPPAAAEDLQSVATAPDSATAAITILLPDLEKQVADSQDGDDPQNLYRTMALARGYLQLGLYDDAEQWFDRMAALDGDQLFADATFNGQLEIAAGRGDFSRVSQILVAQGGGVENPDDALMDRLCRQVAAGGDWNQAMPVIEGLHAVYGEKPPAGILLLEGRALRKQGRLAEAVFHFEHLLDALNEPGEVHPSLIEQRDKLVQSAADCAFLMNDRLRARQLYGELAAASDPAPRAWGRFQTAQLDMLSNDYAGAESGFRSIAADSLGLIIQEWAALLADHCSSMRRCDKFYVSGSSSAMAAVP